MRGIYEKNKNNKSAPKTKRKKSWESLDEESRRRLTEFCYTLIEIDRKTQKQKLETEAQYCFYCGKQITVLNDLFTYDNQNCCSICGDKIRKDPSKPKTFCGLPVVKTKNKNIEN